MIKKISVSILLALAAGNSFAMQCPAASDWIHEKGKPWTLSFHAQAQGWKTRFNSSYDQSDLSTLPANTELTVAVTNWDSYIFPGYYPSCLYTNAANNITGIGLVAINNSDIPVNMNTLDYRHFHGDQNSFICVTTGDKSSECTWENQPKK